MMFQVTNVITILIPLWGMVSRLVTRETLHCADVTIAGRLGCGPPRLAFTTDGSELGIGRYELYR